ncbi:MAG: BatA domain-containing protein [Planctomycetota bacterium]|nr:BatA domain-containing protein [Planctomycetota bacterium]
MSFLQPLMLAALPLISLPIIIHLINQRRFQTMQWAAMMFLLAANRMSRGYAKLRQWLILLFRALVIAGLVFAISRPLASGWLGITAGGRADTTIILLDRSPSMQQQGAGGVVSKLATGREQLVRALNTLGSSRWVLIESTTNSPNELESPDALLRLPSAELTSAAADLPAMLQSAREYIEANQTGRTEIWICSDLRENDWNAASGRWKSLRDEFVQFTQGVRFHLLAYSQTAPDNLAIRVTDVKRQTTGEGAELLVSLVMTRQTDTDDIVSVPIAFEIEGARSVLNVEMVGPTYELKDHQIGLEQGHEIGWGRVSVPADANSADNDFYFAFSKPTARRTIIVADEPTVVRPLQLAAGISPDPTFEHGAEVLTSEQLATVEWEKIALVLWHDSLPEGPAADLVRAFIDRGGQIVYFPPRDPDRSEFADMSWNGWAETTAELAVETWRGDQDLLANTLSGASLPVGQLKIRRHCELTGEATVLASLSGGDPLLVRVSTDRGGIYLCTTTPAASDSSLARDGVVLYVAVQRALAAGVETLGDTQQLVAGDSQQQTDPWQRLAGAEAALSTDYPYHSGVYSSDNRLLAVNRPAAEDLAKPLEDAQLAELFQGLDMVRVDDRAGSIDALIQEIWRLFLATMMVAMVVEAALCLPKLRRAEGAAA